MLGIREWLWELVLEDQSFVRLFASHKFEIISFFTPTALGLAFGILLLGRCLIKEGGLNRYEITTGTLALNTFYFLFFGLMTFLIGMVFTNFVARRSLGIFLLAVYAMYIISILLSHFEVIHPYGTDHNC